MLLFVDFVGQVINEFQCQQISHWRQAETNFEIHMVI